MNTTSRQNLYTVYSAKQCRLMIENGVLIIGWSSSSNALTLCTRKGSSMRGKGKIGVWSGWRGKGPTVKTNYRPLYT